MKRDEIPNLLSRERLRATHGETAYVVSLSRFDVKPQDNTAAPLGRLYAWRVNDCFHITVRVEHLPKPARALRDQFRLGECRRQDPLLSYLGDRERNGIGAVEINGGHGGKGAPRGGTGLTVIAGP